VTALSLRRLLAGLVVVVAFSALAAQADAFVYWSNNAASTVGRANLDGTGANQNFITGATDSFGTAVDGQHIYWSSFDDGQGTAIGRANLDGTGANQNFIAGANQPLGVAVDGQHIYWTNIGPGPGSIGRANLDGTGANQNFITGVNGPGGVAVDGQHIYWSTANGTIGRANVDGTGANQNFIAVAGHAFGVAVDGQHIYWANDSADTIGRANLDGTGVNQNFIAGVGGSDLFGVAVDGQHVYWTNTGAGAIGRANLDGTGANQNFITGASAPTGVAVDPLRAPTKLTATPVLLGGLSATLTQADTGAPVAGQTLTFTAGGTVLCTAVTDSAGTAGCNSLLAVVEALLNLGYTASYAGDAGLLPSSAHGQLVGLTVGPLVLGSRQSAATRTVRERARLSAELHAIGRRRLMRIVREAREDLVHHQNAAR
jgi:hypothetical protein